MRSQLRGVDVIEPGGIQALRLTSEAGTLKTKEDRTVPIHDHLIESRAFLHMSAHGVADRCSMMLQPMRRKIRPTVGCIPDPRKLG